MQRKVAYVFLYKNGIKERSVGILRRYGTAEQPEVALELFGKEICRKNWDIYYFTGNDALKEATFLKGSTAEQGRSEVRLPRYSLCAEAGAGGGVVLLPMNSRSDLREYLCGRYDGREVTERELSEAFRRKPEKESEENPCIESAKKLMEEIAKAAGGEPADTRETAVLTKEQIPPFCRKVVHEHLDGPEKLLRTKPSYMPCHGCFAGYSVRIAPEDLCCLTEEGKGFADNSYLLHGYYRYRHVLLGRRGSKEREEYVLMVPGIYSGKEAEVAEMFGFPEFLPVKKTKPETGSAASGKEWFGYFCGKI